MTAFGRSLALAVTLMGTTLIVSCGCNDSLEQWPLWKAYSSSFINKDGRVVEPSAQDRTTSEAQAYAMFHALVVGDREQFDRILAWTQKNLAKGDLKTNLPSWNWGQDSEGTWRVLDENSASDADLWMTYALLEAGRLWCNPGYSELAEMVAAQIVQREIVDLPGLGPMLLPGPNGFRLDENTWRLNPSYLALPLLRRLGSAGVPGPWNDVLANTVRLLRNVTSSDGFIADWVAYHRTQGFIIDPVSGKTGSYDAIRVYLWVALLSDADPYKAQLMGKLQGMYGMWKSEGRLPEKNDGVAFSEIVKVGPPGFYAALLPMAKDVGQDETFRRLRTMVKGFKLGSLYGAPATYYDQNLILFAEGFVDRRYRFNTDGTLEPRWDRPCKSP